MTPFDQRVLCGIDTDMTIRRVMLTPPGDLAKRKDLEQWAAEMVQKKDNMGYLRLLTEQIKAEWLCREKTKKMRVWGKKQQKLFGFFIGTLSPVVPQLWLGSSRRKPGWRRRIRPAALHCRIY